MAISYIHEALMFYSKQKASITNKLSAVTMNLLSASKKTAEAQSQYNQKLNLFYQQFYEDDPDRYQILEENLQNEHEVELAQLNAWETKLENDKNRYESQYNMLSQYEASWNKLLNNNIKKEFSYGGSGSK